MSIERELIIAVLKLTAEGPVSHELINKTAKVPSETAHNLLRKLQNDRLVYLNEAIVEADSAQRVKLAVKAIDLGADLERVSSVLQWQEFENIAAAALERNGYIVTRNLRFRHGGRKWEIDVVGCRKPSVLCIDCKHWQHGIHPSALKKVTREQAERTKALAESLPNPTVRIECATWAGAKFLPVVLSLVTTRFKFLDDVPIVSVLQLQDFLNKLPAYADSLFRIERTERFGNKL